LSHSIRFAVQLIITAFGATLDYWVGRLSNQPTIGIFLWVAATIVAVTTLDFLHGLRVGHSHSPGGWSSAVSPLGAAVAATWRRAEQFRFRTVVLAIIAALLAWGATYALSAAVIIFRCIAAAGGRPLGKGSPFDQQVIAFMSNFQVSPVVLWITAACLLIALVPHPQAILPLFVFAAAVVNAVDLRIPPLPDMPMAFRSPLALSVSEPDKLLLRFPALGYSLAALAAGMVLCGLVAACSSNYAR
jgi:hypothetical protein